MKYVMKRYIGSRKGMEESIYIYTFIYVWKNEDVSKYRVVINSINAATELI